MQLQVAMGSFTLHLVMVCGRLQHAERMVLTRQYQLHHAGQAVQYTARAGHRCRPWRGCQQQRGGQSQSLALQRFIDGQQGLQVLANETCGGLARHEHRVRQTLRQKRLVGDDAQSHGLLQALQQLSPCFFPGGGVADEFGDHRVVIRRNLCATVQSVFDTQ